MRKIRFGIRFRITGVIMLSVIFASSLIGLALYNAQVKSNREEMLRLGGTILKGGMEYARSYFNNNYLLHEERKKSESSKAKLKLYAEKRKESFRSVMEHFPEMVKREKLLDISFLVEKDIKRGKVQEEYIYFKRKTPGVFSRSKYDPELKNSIVDYFYSNMTLDSHLTFASGRKDAEKSFIIVGVPILDSKKSENFYKGYLNFKKSSYLDVKKILDKKKPENRYRAEFENRIVRLTSDYNYTFNMNNEKKVRYLFYKLMRYYEFKGKKIKLKDLASGFHGKLKSETPSDRIDFKRFRKLFYKMTRNNRLSLKTSSRHIDIWNVFFNYLKWQKIDYQFNESIDELAMKSYNADLMGILGITLHRKTFYGDIEKTGTDIFNLSVSILIRCIFIAIFFPGFIIASVKKLSAGAAKFGEGKLDHRIALNSSDELGQLADQFNSMAHNLEKARVVELEKQRMETELVTAKQIQETLLPLMMPSIDGVELGAHYSSASEAGGDYYDILELDDSKIAIVVADVSGHGVGSGLVMAMTRTLLHTFLKQSSDIKEVIRGINEYLYKNTESKYFVSMFLGIFDPESGSLRYISCGHNPSYLLRGGDLKEVPAGGIALGVVGTETFERMLKVKSLELKESDLFVQYTDGIPEMMNSEGEEYGDEAFKRTIVEKYKGDTTKLVEGIISSVDDFRGGALQHDDVTLVAMKYLKT